MLERTPREQQADAPPSSAPSSAPTPQNAGAADFATYHIQHLTEYHYESPVRLSQQVLRLSPRPLAWQTCLAHQLTIQPEPAHRQHRIDPFGNPVVGFALEEDHNSLSVTAETWVRLVPRTLPDLDTSANWENVRERLRYQAGRIPSADDLEASCYLFESPHVRIKRDFAQWALESFPPRQPLLVGVLDLMQRIHQEFAFDPKATTIATPVTEVFTKRRGVCQDFAHMMLSGLRSLGIAARYVSGYLLTQPPPGKPRMIGADASHAWVSVYCPELGWVDFDPTNNILPNLEHITLGWGRDFADISPMRGVLIGGGEHRLNIAVTVVPEAEYSSLFSGYGEADAAPDAKSADPKP